MKNYKFKKAIIKEEIKLQIAEILKKLDPSSLIDEPGIQKD